MAEKDKICSNDECYGKLKNSQKIVACMQCPRAYHLACVDVTVDLNTFTCSSLGRTCTDRITPILK